ncbi:MAG: hypothetical protein AAF192_00360 [Pseudomonadota bacterium]
MFEDTMREHRRLAILRHLEACTDYTSNGSILIDICRGVGVPTSHDQLRTELAWLKEQGLATLADHGDFHVATATRRGVEAALGQAVTPGVKRPSAD